MARKRIFKSLDSEMLDKVKENGIKEGLRWGGLRQVEKCELITSDPFVFSVENFGEDYLTPNGLADGDTEHYDFEFVPIEEAGPCDMHGRLMSEADFFSGKFYDRIYTAVERRDAENLRILLERETDCLIESAEGLAEKVRVFLDLNRDEEYTQSVIRDVEDEIDDEDLEENNSSVKLRKNSPQFACVKGDSRGKYNSRAEDRDNSGTVKDYYKEKRKGGGRLSRGQARIFGRALLTSLHTYDLHCEPRVAVTNGIPERFFKTKRRQR